MAVKKTTTKSQTASKRQPARKIRERRLLGIDIETHDPHLKDKGESWIWNDGEVLVAAVSDGTKKNTVLYKGTQLKELKKLFNDPLVTLVGANISYDILWLCHTLKISVTKIKAELIDIQDVEGLINPFTPYSLDALVQRYLNDVKGAGKLPELAKKYNLSGDFRAHLKKLIELGHEKDVDNYVLSDAYQPVKIYQKQMKLIEELNCMEAYNVYTRTLRVAMQMKQNGIKIDYEKWEENSAKLVSISSKLEKEFTKNYGEVNINSPAQVGKMFLANGFAVKFKITVRGLTPPGGIKFFKKKHGFTNEERKAVFKRLQEIVPAFLLEKNILFLECAADKVQDMQLALGKLGYNTIASPLVNKVVLQSAEEKVVKDFLLLKQVRNIQTKFLGDNFKRYFTFKSGECRLHGTFQPIGARTTGRFSSTKPNLQNIPARVVLWEKTKKEINIAAMCREVFIPEEGHTFVRLDYSGQENRWMAYFGIGEDGEFIRAKYREDPNFDEHDFVVVQSGLLEDHDSRIARKYAKTIRFATAYGASIKRIAKGNNWSYDKAKLIVGKILASSPWFSETKNSLIKKLSSGELTGIRTALKRFIQCPSKDSAYKYYNYLIQGSGADQMKAALVQLYDFIEKNKYGDVIIPILTVHDEVCYSIAPEHLHIVQEIKRIMEEAIPTDVPFVCDPEEGPNWAYTKEMEERYFEEMVGEEDVT